MFIQRFGAGYSPGVGVGTKDASNSRAVRETLNEI